MTTSTVDRFVKLFIEGDPEGMLALCRSDALVDVNVPQWRYQVHPDAMLGGLRASAQLPERRVTIEYSETTRDGAVVEMETTGLINNEPGLVREVWMLRTDGEKITEWISYCTGPWDAATIKRQRAEAPMVRT